MTQRLDFSLGPVQGFVAQSRRTRDLWGSSYLLSFLSAHAMHGAEMAGGRIIRPVLDRDPLYRWVAGVREGEPPRIGSVPNHFVVEVDGDAPIVAQAGLRAMDQAWQRACQAVWERFVEPASRLGRGTDEIWTRQVGSFWEVMWTAGDGSGAEGLLRRRKQWRSQLPPDEPGDKCTVMHDLQELSGFVRSRGRQDRADQEAFWREVRKRTGLLDLRQDERLCAVALVKRLFPRISARALGWEVQASHWPSTTHIGALPWIRRVVQVAPGKARDYAEAVRQSALEGALTGRQAPQTASLGKAAGEFHNLDANYYHQAFVRDPKLCPLAEGTHEGARDEMQRLLKELQGTRDASGLPLGPPPRFYALVLADGDRLGRLVARLGPGKVGRALEAFTGKVPEIVQAHDGVTVYAGGDDVLAMVPLAQGLPCASALARGYTDSFQDGVATLSAGVVLGHVRLPLSRVLQEAHHLLDRVAKEANGRNSLAAAVLKRSGLHCQWVTSWLRALPEGGGAQAVELLETLTDTFRREAVEPGFASSLLYRIRETLSLLCGWPRWEPGSWGILPEGLDLRAFLRAENLRSLEGRNSEKIEERADRLTDLILPLLQPSRAPGASPPAPQGPECGMDALHLARFLANPTELEEEGR